MGDWDSFDEEGEKRGCGAHINEKVGAQYFSSETEVKGVQHAGRWWDCERSAAGKRWGSN